MARMRHVRALERWSVGAFGCYALTLFTLLTLSAGCATPQKQDRAAVAKVLFEQSVTLHQQHQFSEAANGYEKLLKTYRDQPYWCAQALRSLGNVRAAQDKLDEAVKLYRQVGEKYPQQDWEVLQ